MSCRVNVTNPKTHITYVYESTSYWDKELKQPRNHRKLIGKLNEKGELVPTGKKGRPRKEPEVPAAESESSAIEELQKKADSYFSKWQESEQKNLELEREIRKLRAEKEAAGKKLEALIRDCYS